MRITPAWAGKRARPSGSALRNRDYPRVGGEERHANNHAVGRRGLPPRGRGRVIKSSVSIAVLRITPAWAGKSSSLMARRAWSMDYPRVGGEEVAKGVDAVRKHGLPPRGRGRVYYIGYCNAQIRITPAWAGKSVKSWIPTVSGGDYPRVGGEEAMILPTSKRAPGLPPRGRGRDRGRGLQNQRGGITPAWAGKRRGSRRSRCRARDYPRVGGEESAG